MQHETLAELAERVEEEVRKLRNLHDQEADLQEALQEVNEKIVAQAEKTSAEIVNMDRRRNQLLHGTDVEGMAVSHKE